MSEGKKPEYQAMQDTQISAEMKQRLLEQLDAGKKAIEELSDEEVMEATGGLALGRLSKLMDHPVAVWGGRAFDVATIGGAAYSLLKTGKISS
jgi:hypothetical protein